MSYPILDTQLFQQFQKPLHRPGGFAAHDRSTFQSCIKLAYCIPFVSKRLLGELDGDFEFRQDIPLHVEGNFRSIRRSGAVPHQGP